MSENVIGQEFFMRVQSETHAAIGQKYSGAAQQAENSKDIA